MISTQFISAVRTALEAPLPGLDAQMQMAPQTRVTNVKNFRVPENAKLSAVLMLFYPGEDGIHLPLILRNDYKGVHSRQIGLPGGTWEESDGGLLRTALRETNEEIGVEGETVEVLGALSQLYIPPSNYLVQPYVGVVQARPEFVPDPNEVGELIEAPLAHFSDPAYVGTSQIQHRTGGTWEVPSYTIKGHVVWGATAMMMSELMRVVEKI